MPIRLRTARSTRLQYACLSLVTWILMLAMSVAHADDAAKKEKKAVPPMSRSELLKLFASEFVEIIPGSEKFPATFLMGSDRVGSEKPVHEVTLKHRFGIAKYEVPQNLWEAVTGANPSKWKGPRNSVEMFSWKEARDFCHKTTELMRAEKLLADDEEIRLPSEAEWEYCCRAGTKTAYSFGDEATKEGDAGNKASLLGEFAWHTGNAAGNDPPVGALKPNAWGLYDMHGYLWEFTEDTWHDNYEGAPMNDQAWTEVAPKQVVLRSGSWKDHYSKLTSSTRRAVSPELSDDAVGLRCVKAKRR